MLQLGSAPEPATIATFPCQKGSELKNTKNKSSDFSFPNLLKCCVIDDLATLVELKALWYQTSESGQTFDIGYEAS